MKFMLRGRHSIGFDSRSADRDEQQQIEKDIESLEVEHEKHCEEARLSHEYYLEQIQKCKRAMDKINEASDDDEADQLRSRFTLVISTDYQMNKLTPHWGYSPQPGSTYYLQKLSHDLLGIVNHSDEASTAVYVFDERCGPKNTDHTVSYITDYVR